MRTRFPQSAGLLVVLLLSSLPARADHPPEWLKLPAAEEPRPTRVSSWVIADTQRVTQVSVDTVTYRYRYAIMVLSEAGVKHAQFAIPYTAGSSSVSLAKGWAMSPDGKKCREFAGNEFVIGSSSVSNWMWDLSKEIYFDAENYLQPGWIFAYEIEIKSDSTPFDINWSPRASVPVKFASLELMPMAGGSVKWKAFSKDLPGPVPIDTKGALAWTISNLAPYDVDVPSDLERNSMNLRAYLLAGPAETKSWGDVVRLARAEMDPKAVATPALVALAKGKEGTGTLWSRILPVCVFVQKEVTYLGITIDTDSMAGYRPHSAAEVCDNRYGDCKDKAVLLCALLQGIGVEAHVMIVNSGAPRTNIVDWPSAYFNHAIVAIPCREAAPDGAPVVRAGNTDYLLFDPTDDEVPFGLLPMGDTGGEGLILAPGISSTVTIPSFPPDQVTDSSVIKTVLAPDGSGSVAVSEKRFGLIAAEAVALEETESLAERTGSLERRIQRRVPLMSDLVWDSTQDGSLHTWTRNAHFSAQYIGKRMTGGMYVSTDLMSVVPNPAPWEDDSGGWVSITPGTLHREIELDPPAGWEFSEFPDDWSLKSSAGEGSLRYWKDAGVAKGEMTLKVQGGVVDRAGYLHLRELMHAAIAAERRPVVLRKIKPAATPSNGSAAAAH